MLGLVKTFTRTNTRHLSIAHQYTTKSKSLTTSSNVSTSNQSKLFLNESIQLAKIRKELQKPDVKPIFINDGRPTGTFYIATLGLLGLGLLSNVKSDKKEFA